MTPPRFQGELFTSFRLWLFAIGLTVAFGLVWLKNTVLPATPQATVTRAIASAIGSGEPAVIISAQYNLSGLQPRGYSSFHLVCGSFGTEGRPFAALVEKHGRQFSAYYSVDDLALAPLPQRGLIVREAELLARCASRK